MIYCEKCGTELKDDARFCKSCGWKVGKPLPEQTEDSNDSSDEVVMRENREGIDAPSKATDVDISADRDKSSTSENVTMTNQKQPETSSDPEASNETARTTKKNPLASLPKYAKIGIGIGVIVALVATIAIIAFTAMNSGVSEDTLRKDMQGSSIVQNGAVPSSYVNESPYELTDLNIDSKQEESGEIFGVSVTARSIAFSGTIKNANFETQFTGSASYGKDGDEWVIIGSPSIDSSTTTPLKGVDRLTVGESAATSPNDPAISDFNSDLIESSGTYTSTASQRVTHDNDIATDTALNTLTLIFDQEDGWTAQGKVQVTETKTEWNLAGRTFEYVSPSSFSTSDSTKATIAFGNNDESGLPTATYALSYTAPTGTSRAAYYRDVSLEGTLVIGVIDHDIGSSNYVFELNDSDNKVTFRCSSRGSSLINAGAGSVTTFSAQIITEAIFWENNFGDSNEFEISNASFTEVA